MNPITQFVFGYGSLICPDSRAITAPTIADRTALPVHIDNVERTWAKQSQTSKATSMGVQFLDGAHCVGVLVPVTAQELQAFDTREVGYDRHSIPLADISSVEHLLETSDDKSIDDKDSDVYQNTFLDDDMESSRIEDVNVWIYVQREPVPATPQYPIAQSYVDIMLRGCLSISEEFTHEFIQTTKGWHPAELQDMVGSENDSEKGSDNNDRMSTRHSSSLGEIDYDFLEEEDLSGWWVDDRKDPLYVRADSEYSLKHQDQLDSLLKEQLPDQVFGSRIRRGRSQVLTQHQVKQ